MVYLAVCSCSPHFSVSFLGFTAMTPRAVIAQVFRVSDETDETIRR